IIPKRKPSHDNLIPLIKMAKTLLILVIFVSFFSSNLNAAQDSISGNEAGVTERLGKFIPLNLKFARETGDSVMLGQLIDKPTIFMFVYFDCTELCIPLMGGVSDVIKKTDLRLGKDYQVITISIDPNDTPEKAKRSKATFTRTFTPDQAKGWTFLTADSVTVFKMIRSVGYNIKQVGLQYVHPAAIVVVSPKGMVTRYLYGLSFLPFDIKMAVAEASKGIARPTIQKLLLYCFSYDPAGKRYTLEVTKLSGIIIVFIIMLFGIILIVKKRRKA
ncbi:MAG: SCO family protein, partial [Bacteroidota bacterium]|nr:SCO family protein [Bacteroidota bacterium]